MAAASKSVVSRDLVDTVASVSLVPTHIMYLMVIQFNLLRMYIPAASVLSSALVSCNLIDTSGPLVPENAL